MRGRIIDVAKLQSYDSDDTFHSTQEVLRGRESFTITNAWSLQEMSSKLTQEMVATTSFLGVKKTTHRFKDVATRDVRDQACVYARLQKTVASRSIDDGAVRYIVNLPSEELTYGLPFSAEFQETYNTILATSGDAQKGAIQKMLDDYGTHLITEASVGCMMDMALTFEKSQSYDMETTAETTCRSIFGRSSGKGSLSMDSHLTCRINNSNCIQIFGGSAEKRNALISQVQNLTEASQLSPDAVEEWLSSVSAGMLKDSRENLEVIDFHFIPIWELFSNPSVRGLIQQQVIERSSRSDCSFTEAELSIDNYEIDLTNPWLTSFGTGSNATLVRLARLDDNWRTPILEICQEYVPKICSDRRITVLYPIFQGITRLGQGLFPGDGTGNPPAILTFSDGDVFVNPIDGYGYRDQIQKAYYIHGNLYTDSYEMGINRNHNLIVEDEWLHLFSHKGVDGAGNYPIVKIGSGFWSRCNATDKLGFATTYRGRSQSSETVIKVNGRDMLFANVFDDLNPELTSIRNFTARDSLMWNLPTSKDLNDLRIYIGNNTKSLFKNQMTGFDAEFAGYYGTYDLINNVDCGFYDWLYANQYCFIAFRDDASKGTALILSPDYTSSSKEFTKDVKNRYPVRPFRNKIFRHE